MHMGNPLLDLRPGKTPEIQIRMEMFPTDYDALLHNIDTHPLVETYAGPTAKRISTGFMSEMSRILKIRR